MTSNVLLGVGFLKNIERKKAAILEKITAFRLLISYEIIYLYSSFCGVPQ
ncbi:hypothetical protein SAMN05444483_11736 [Salegentibacter echinorum]|uniref:Uncharacterized protein n=1 Tax=Salegentibacter echinorum TaxID=1073325 RepID=A0A1M5KZX5_SALEC|nr:hypothetical protein SAMN05444483_11736 [Salegentibacter echinorum]